MDSEHLVEQFSRSLDRYLQGEEEALDGLVPSLQPVVHRLDKADFSASRAVQGRLRQRLMERLGSGKEAGVESFPQAVTLAFPARRGPRRFAWVGLFAALALAFLLAYQTLSPGPMAVTPSATATLSTPTVALSAASIPLETEQVAWIPDAVPLPEAGNPDRFSQKGQNSGHFRIP